MKENLKKEKLSLFEVLDRLSHIEKITDFPKVSVDQTNFRISDIIKRNLAGEQVLGNQNLQYDYESSSKEPDFDNVNPFSDMGFDLDDVIRLARINGQKVTDLQNRQGEIKAALDKAKAEELASTVNAAPAPPTSQE